MVSYQEGDILFYNNMVSPYERIISMWEHSPVTHVAIACCDGGKIEAVNTGIQQVGLGNVPIYASFRPDKLPNLIDAMAWLKKQVGTPYGWSDILTAANPWHQYIYAVRPDYYDCSALATQFLLKAGYPMGDWSNDPHTVTPAVLFEKLMPGANPLV